MKCDDQDVRNRKWSNKWTSLLLDKAGLKTENRERVIKLDQLLIWSADSNFETKGPVSESKFI